MAYRMILVLTTESARMLNKLLGVLVILLTCHGLALADDGLSISIEGEPLSLIDFVKQGTQSDTQFEEILVDQMLLNYQKDLRLPPADLILSVKEQYHLFIEPNKERGETSVSLNQLFPMTGTQIEVGYESTPISATQRNASTISMQVTQSIAQNAFGHSTRLLDKIIGLEVDIARHQVTEAYEDYLSVIIFIYFEWYEAYENLQIGISSYRENLKLLTNIRDRQKSNIALPIDVNKVEIQVMDKHEALITFSDNYTRQSNLIRRILRVAPDKNMIPSPFEYVYEFKSDFSDAYRDFESQSRTYQILELLGKNSALKMDRDAHDLLPSIDLFMGYEVEGTDFNVEDNDRLFYAGVQFDWPLQDTVDRAEYKISQLNDKKTQYNISNTQYFLRAQLGNVYAEVQRELKLIDIAQKKIVFAQAVLSAETENYTFGKVTLNDYIRAVNALDNARFNYVSHDLRLKKITLEWRRLTDTLITEADIQENHSKSINS